MLVLSGFFLTVFLLAATWLGAKEARAGAIVYDEMGRLMDPEEAFYINNPPPPGQKRAPIPEADAYDHMGFTPLIKAISARDKAEMGRLLDRKANPNILSAGGHTALEYAAKSDDVEIAALLLKRGAKAEMGYPLKYAKSPEMSALLKKHGAVASEPPQKRTIQLFFEEEADVLKDILAEEEKSGKMNPSIPVAVVLGRSPEEIAKLLEQGSDINEEHPTFRTALDQAIFQGHSAEYFAFLLKSGADPNRYYGYYGWPLYEAVDAERTDLVDLLLASGARLKQRPAKIEGRHLIDGHRRALLYLAVDKGNVAIAKSLLAAGADPNEIVMMEGEESQRREDPPLLRAVFYNTRSPEMVRLLLHAGADPKAKDAAGRNALAILKWNDNNLPIALALLEGGVSGTDSSIVKEHDETLIHWALALNSQELYLAARKAKVPVTERDRDMNTPLLQAVRQGNVWFVRALLEAGAPVNKSATYPGQRYADYERSYKATDDLLACAVQSGNLEVVQILLKARVDINTKANIYDQGTALHIAVEKKRPDLVAALLNAGAKTEVTDRYNRTPLHYAAGEDNAEVVTLLLKAGASPKAKDKDGITPLETARQHGSGTEIIRLLQQAK